ncbi:MAG TPA: enoyl-CoA hydratase-related protein, partial [Acidimicrobiia bacterium]
RYEAVEGIATVTISRPEVLNALRPLTVEELIEAFHEAWADRSVGVVILTGAGDKAFCVGGDATARADDGGYKPVPGHRPARSDLGIDMEDLHTAIRDIPKPVIAAVNGYAIGGGHVIHVLCDLTIAADHAKFGQVGPKVGSVDPGFGTAYLARLVGQKKAREIWYLCRQYSATEALEMGLVNTVVPKEQLMDEARAWAAEILAKSPTALKLAKASFNAETEHIRGIGSLAMTGLALYYDTEESAEGTLAFQEKRPPDFGRFRK